jgi:hypothetical protein
MYYSTKRQQFLVDQGYAYHVVTNLLEGGQQEGLRFSSQNEQINLLTQVGGVGWVGVGGVQEASAPPQTPFDPLSSLLPALRA